MTRLSNLDMCPAGTVAGWVLHPLGKCRLTGIIPVAVLGSDTFDVRDLRTDSTLSFNGRAVRIRGKKGPLCHYDFYDDDSFEDLVCQFDDDPGEITADCKVCLEKRRHFT